MPVVTLIVVGIVGGLIGSFIVGARSQSIVGDLFLGVVGAFTASWLLNQLGSGGVTGLNVYSILVAAAGAVVLLVVYHAFRGNRGRRSSALE